MSSFSSTKVLSIGGSRNVGYLSSIRLLDKGASVTFLLRSPSCFDADETIQKYIKAGKARLVKGDALVKADVAKAWGEAAQGDGEQRVDVLLFTVGAIPKISLTKGAVQTPVNLVTQSLINALSTVPAQSPAPKIITLSSTGLTKSSHAQLPLPYKPLYSWLLKYPHQDKIGSEKVVAYCAGRPWDANDGDVGADIMGENWEEGLPRGTLPDIVVLRPAMFIGEECKADIAATKGKGTGYRVQERDITSYAISRKDVAHFIVEGVLSDWDTWKGKYPAIGY